MNIPIFVLIVMTNVLRGMYVMYARFNREYQMIAFMIYNFILTQRILP